MLKKICARHFVYIVLLELFFYSICAGIEYICAGIYIIMPNAQQSPWVVGLYNTGTNLETKLLVKSNASYRRSDVLDFGSGNRCGPMCWKHRLLDREQPLIQTLLKFGHNRVIIMVRSPTAWYLGMKKSSYDAKRPYLPSDPFRLKSRENSWNSDNFVSAWNHYIKTAFAFQKTAREKGVDVRILKYEDIIDEKNGYDVWKSTHPEESLTQKQFISVLNMKSKHHGNPRSLKDARSIAQDHGKSLLDPKDFKYIIDNADKDFLSFLNYTYDI